MGNYAKYLCLHEDKPILYSVCPINVKMTFTVIVNNVSCFLLIE